MLRPETQTESEIKTTVKNHERKINRKNKEEDFFLRKNKEIIERNN